MILADRVKLTSTTTGTGNVTVSSTPFPRHLPLSVFSAGSANVPMLIENEAGTDWELSYCTILDATTFSRDTVIRSSNAGNKVNFAAGSKTVFCTVPADVLAKFLALNSTEISTAVDTSTLLFLVNGEARPMTVANFLATFGSTAGNLPAAGVLSGTDIVPVVQNGVEVKTTLTAIAAAVAAINGTADTTAPTASSAVVQNATPTIVTVTMSEALAAVTPANSAFTVANHTVTGVAVSGNTVALTVTPAFVNGEAASTVAYTKPGANALQDAAANQTATFSGLAITNNVAAAGDTTPPTFTSALVANATPTVIEITMSETMANVTPATSAFTVSGGKTVSSVAVSGNKVNVTVNSAYVNGDTITVQYTKPGANQLQDAAGNQTASFGPSSVTNNVAATGTAYTISGFSGNTVNATIDATSPSTTQGSLKGFTYIKSMAAQYWSISPTPASARCGWSQSNSTPPSDITSAQNLAGASSINGLVPMGHPGAWTNDGYLWVPSGSGSTTWYFWVKPVDGVAQCMNPSGATVTGA